MKGFTFSAALPECLHYSFWEEPVHLGFSCQPTPGGHLGKGGDQKTLEDMHANGASASLSLLTGIPGTGKWEGTLHLGFYSPE